MRHRLECRLRCGAPILSTLQTSHVNPSSRVDKANTARVAPEILRDDVSSFDRARVQRLATSLTTDEKIERWKCTREGHQVLHTNRHLSEARPVLCTRSTRDENRFWRHVVVLPRPWMPPAQSRVKTNSRSLWSIGIRHWCFPIGLASHPLRPVADIRA